MLPWTISSQVIATLGLRSACAAGFKHRHPVAIAEDGLCALFGLPYVIFLSLLSFGSPTGNIFE